MHSGLFGLAYFLGYAKQLMQINKFVEVVYENTAYEDTIFIIGNL